MDVTVFVGSGYPEVDKLRRGLSTISATYEEEGVEPTVKGVDYPSFMPWLEENPYTMYKLFQALLHEHKSTDMVLLASGGTGAARLTQYWKMEDKPNEFPVVAGCSDSSIYPLMTWLWGSELAFHGPNVAEGIAHGDLKELDEPPTDESRLFHKAIPSFDFGVEDYSVFPICTRVLSQCSERVKDQIRRRLTSEPTLLLLEDNYPYNSVGLFTFYEDVTYLMDIFVATMTGKGAVGISSIHECWGVTPMGILMDALGTTKALDMPIIYGMDYGHKEGPFRVIRYGSKWRLRYLEGAGVLVTVE